jgi:hypothetical protein
MVPPNIVPVAAADGISDLTLKCQNYGLKMLVTLFNSEDIFGIVHEPHIVCRQRYGMANMLW